MSRFIIAAVVIAVVVTVYAVIDCAMSDSSRARVLRKPTWLFVILLVPLVGPILWILVGQGRLLKPVPEASAPSAPDDDETFLRSIGIDDGHDETIRRLEEELRALDDEAADDRRKPGGTGESAGDPAPGEGGESDAPFDPASDGDDDDPHGPADGGHHTPGQRPDHDDGTGGAGGTTRA